MDHTRIGVGILAILVSFATSQVMLVLYGSKNIVQTLGKSIPLKTLFNNAFTITDCTRSRATPYGHTSYTRTHASNSSDTYNTCI